MEEYNISKLNQKALNFAYFYLKFRQRTKQEIVRYLEKKSEKYGFTQQVIEYVITQLEDQNLVNDKDFVKTYVEARISRKPKGETALRNELIKLGIQKDILDLYFSQSPIDQHQQSHQALVTRWRRYSSLDPKKRFEKAASFLLRRGFSFDVIKKTIAEIEEKEYNMS